MDYIFSHQLEFDELELFMIEGMEEATKHPCALIKATALRLQSAFEDMKKSVNNEMAKLTSEFTVEQMNEEGFNFEGLERLKEVYDEARTATFVLGEFLAYVEKYEDGEMWLYRIASNRRILADMELFNSTIGKVFEGCEDINLEVAQDEELTMCEKYTHKRTLPFYSITHGHEAYELLTLMKYELDYYEPPLNSERIYKCMKIAFSATVRSSNGRVSKVPDWFSPTYTMTYPKVLRLRGSEVAMTYRGEIIKRMGDEEVKSEAVIKKMHGFDRAEIISAAQRQLEMWWEMKNDNVVKLLGGSHCSQHVTFAMEHVNGIGITAYMKTVSPEDYKSTLCNIVKQAINGLIYLGDNDDPNRRFHTTHGNLKPSNIIVDMEGVVKLTDFGAAYTKFFSGLIQYKGEKVAEGIYTWFAPECRNPSYHPTHASDVYSLGLCIMAVLLKSEDSVIQSNGKHSDLLNKVPEPFHDVLLKMCSPDPKERPRLEEVHDEFSEIQERV